MTTKYILTYSLLNGIMHRESWGSVSPCVKHSLQSLFYPQKSTNFFVSPDTKIAVGAFSLSATSAFHFPYRTVFQSSLARSTICASVPYKQGGGGGVTDDFQPITYYFLSVLLMSARRYSCDLPPLTPIIPAHPAFRPQVQLFPHLRQTGGWGHVTLALLSSSFPSPRIVFPVTLPLTHPMYNPAVEVSHASVR
jgi:hypothetical protein